ncbi:DUF3413 domain-containing protein [Thalassotalea sp. LPB0316]|uniref:DUF3413 domain-containing protein n=1 Tax=Thalassotalea sp. LPB0316 TaxID=2769490 RepID=UPI0018683098|nr:DUF3413 domain-containing protein [Thalassotalea sp. LPB0316]QOL24862.1 DUF3413 domain-containing protein [Thalassotalea sp. LPB0316]
MATIVSKDYSKKLLKLISWSHWFTFFNIAIAIACSVIYIASEPLPETLLGQVYLIANWFSHMAFITFLAFVLIVFPITLLLPYTRFIRASASVVFTVYIMLLLLDGYIYSQLGYHINSSSSDQILAVINTQIEADSRAFWFTAVVVCIIALSVELVISNYAWKHLEQLQNTKFAKYFIHSFVGLFFFSHITHIWADANLNYDILGQDNVLPLSYPLTAKTLLTKYGMFDKNAYLERRTNPLKLAHEAPSYPELTGQCRAHKEAQRALIVLTKNNLSQKNINQFSERSNQRTTKLLRHTDSAELSDAWFNLFYSLPTIYQPEVLAQQKAPVLFQALSQQGLTSSFTQVGSETSHGLPSWASDLFESEEQIDDISPYLNADIFEEIPPGLHVIYFDQEDNYQYQIFVDALLLAQKQNRQNDIVFISRIGNQNLSDSLSKKPALLISPHIKKVDIDERTNHMDIAPTLLNHWLACDIKTPRYSVGKSIVSLKRDRVLANTHKNGIMVFDKDRSVFVDQNSNFQTFSQRLGEPIMDDKDFPLLIDGIHYITQFSTNNATSNEQVNNK